uniref:Transposase IS200-like domain-containing protein n=1 Tax=Candidatus Methanophaga sp. ANME-1 ERB7 TaxID=2759913 RepID=A0A7G9Z4M6_9EURY|nr:hypothetical protein MHJDHPNH_00012 [Methanosarcinales archaeon ANME-1 ERB7]
MGEVEAEKDIVTRHDLRHDRHTVSLLTDHIVFSPKYRGKVLEGEVADAAEEIIRENCKELDISGQKGYEKADTVPMVVINEEKEKLRTHKTWYVTFYNKLFGGKHQKHFLKIEKLL